MRVDLERDSSESWITGQLWSQLSSCMRQQRMAERKLFKEITFHKSFDTIQIVGIQTKEMLSGIVI